MTILEKVRVLVGDSTSIDVLNLYIDIATDKVKNYCNREDIPKGLENVIVQMVADEVKKANAGDVQAIKRGDVSVQFKADNKGSTLDKYKDQLRVYKKLRTLRRD